MTTDAKKMTAEQRRRIALYERAGNRRYINDGICAFLPNEEADHMMNVFLDRIMNPEQRFGWWMQERGEPDSDETTSRRRLACAFMIALIEAGDA